MLDLSNISNITKDQFEKLNTEEKKLVLTILDELRKYGKSEALDSLWYQDYEEIPVSIQEFISNPYYLGKSTRNGESIYPYWKKTYNKIFDASLGYEEIIFTGAIGVGKTKTADVCLAYLLYKLMCLKNPQEYFKFNEGEKITIFFLNINLKLAEGVGFRALHEFLINSPWFRERGTVTGRTKVLYKPPKNIDITFGSKGEHALGQQVYCAMLDECNFKSAAKDLNVLDAQNGIMDAYRTIRGRMTSRFIKNGVQYGRMFLVSSKRSDQDFVDTYINKRKSDGEADKMLIIDEPQWVIKPEGTFSKETFPVAVGNKSLASRVLNEDTQQVELDALEKQGYRILHVPMDMKADFLLDVNKSLMDLAGISVIGATSFFNVDMFSKCYVEDYHNPFVTDILTIGMHDDLQIANFFEINDVPLAVRSMPQFIHIDASLTGDKTGISSVGCSGLKETRQYNGAQEIISQEMVYKHIFSVDIKAPQGTEISFEKTRQFIYFLKASGFNIRGVSLDGFQSADTKQILRTQGYDAEIVSLDKTPQGYLTLRSAMNDGRIGLIQIDLLETELIQLQRDVRSGKIDHPDGGCFTADTLIQLVDGRQLSIADLLIEQKYKTNYVYTVNEVTKKIEPKPIKKVFQTKLVTDLIEVELDNGEKIQCTPEHRFMLRDGTYLQACELIENTSLMPLYTKICNNGLIGYRMFYDPFTQKWHFEHRMFCTNIKNTKGVVHHKNYNKLDNRPTNLIKISTSEHCCIHNNSTMDYNKVSISVKRWHDSIQGTDTYLNRCNSCRQGTYNYLKSKNNNYIPLKELQLQKIKNIEEMFNITWNNLTPSEKDSYSVKYSRIIDPSITLKVANKISELHKQGKYTNAIAALANRVWYTDGKNNIYIKENDIIPDGYTRGRTLNKDIFANRKKLSDKPEAEQALIKYKCGSSARGKKWINNGQVERYINPDDCIPEGFTFGRLKREYKNHKVVSVTYIHKPCRVYDLEIEDNHNFALASGVFVHNSKDMADSLAGALWNATLHKQSLIDGLQLLESAVDVNDLVDPRQEMINDLQQSMMSATQLSAQSKLDELISGFESADIIGW